MFVALGPKPHSLEGIWVLVNRDGHILVGGEDAWSLPHYDDLSKVLGDQSAKDLEPHSHFIGRFHEQPCFALAVDTFTPDTYHSTSLSYRWQAMRELLMQCQPLMDVLSTASQVVHWDAHHRYCSRCGTLTQRAEHEHARVCPSCDYRQYPRVSPCAIVVVYREGQLLLGRSPHFPSGMYSAFAGFLEAGESAEAAAHREIYEEVRVTVCDLSYVRSQSWPFPHSLMLGYLARHEAGEPQFDGVEIEDARWFNFDDLPRIPPSGSISRLLIEEAIDQCQKV